MLWAFRALFIGIASVGLTAAMWSLMERIFFGGFDPLTEVQGVAATSEAIMFAAACAGFAAILAGPHK